MRALATLTSDNLRDNRGRAVYLVITLAITTSAWLLLAALAAPFVGGTTATHGSGVTLHNGSQASAALPLSYARRIEAMHGAHDVAWIGMQGVQCTSATTVALYAWGGPGTAAHLGKHKIPAATMQRWQADPLGVLISNGAIDKCGWQVGQSVAPPMMSNAKPIEMHIVGTFHGTYPSAFVHFAYTNRVGSVQGKNKVVYYVASAADPRRNELLAARIEAEFAHDFPAVRATTDATAQNAWARFGKVQLLLAFVMAAILLCAASVLVSALAHAAVQRRRRFAVLQVLGFQRTTLFGAFALELLATLVLGALLGVGFATLAGHELAPTTFGFLSGGVQVPEWAWWGLPGWLAVLFVAALAWPAALIARGRPADYRAF